MLHYMTTQEMLERKADILGELGMTENEMHEAADNYRLNPGQRDIYREHELLTALAEDE